MKHIIPYNQAILDLELLEYSGIKASLQKVRELIRDGANVNCFDDDKFNTPLIIATKKLNYSTIKLLIENGADVNLVNKNNKNCLFYIVNQNSYTYNSYKKLINNIVDLIINNKINLNAKNKKNLDIFSDIKESNPFILEYIIDNFPDKYKEYLMIKNTDKFNI